MKKKQLEAEIDSIIQEATNLQEEVELEMSTAHFLQNESKKLVDKMNSEDTSFEEMEQIYKQMAALRRKLEIEILDWNKNMPKLKHLESKLDILKSQITVTE